MDQYFLGGRAPLAFQPTLTLSPQLSLLPFEVYNLKEWITRF